MTGWVLEKGSDALGQADNIDRKFGNYFSAFVSDNSPGARCFVGAGANLPGSFSLKSVKSVTETRGLGANCHDESAYLVCESEPPYLRVISRYQHLDAGLPGTDWHTPHSPDTWGRRLDPVITAAISHTTNSEQWVHHLPSLVTRGTQGAVSPPPPASQPHIMTIVLPSHWIFS